MEDDDRDSHGSSENEQDEVMEDAEAAENENEPEDDNDEEEAEEEDAPEREEQGPDPEHQSGAKKEEEKTQDNRGEGAPTVTRTSPTPQRKSTTPLPMPRLRPLVRPEMLTAAAYDIVPTMAAPQATSINAMAITPDLRYWMTGGSDGYVRKYDGPGTINGKQLLTVAQRHSFVDSVVKAGVLMSYWENEEPSPPNARGAEEHVLSAVYSLAVHSQALWLLSGTEGGGINLQSVRHDEGKRITCLQGHSNAVSVLQLAPDEKSVLSGSWDKKIFDWDLNNGSIKRKFDGSGGQISALEPRPASGAPIPQDSYAGVTESETFASSNAAPLPNGILVNGVNDASNEATSAIFDGDGAADAPGSPAPESLFGSPGGSLFGENDNVSGNPFGEDNDNEFSQAAETALPGNPGENGVDGSGDLAMTGVDMPAAPGSNPETLLASAAPQSSAEASQAPLPNETAAGALNRVGDTEVVNGDSQGAQTDSSNAPISTQDHQASSQPQDSAPNLVFASQPGPSHLEASQSSDSTFFSAAIDGTIRIWDRRVQAPAATIHSRTPWCMGACWSPDGNWIYAGRRNGAVEEFNIHKARSGWEPERVLKFPGGSGAVSAVRPMANGRHLICASYDILRLWDLHDTAAFKHGKVPFLIVPGPPKAGVISQLYIDQSSRFMISAAGTRGWEGSSTEVMIGYEIRVSNR